MGQVVPLQQLVRLLLHRRVLPPLVPAEAFRVVAADHLTEEALLRVVPELLRVVERRVDLEEPLQLVHDLDRVQLEFVSVNDM